MGLAATLATRTQKTTVMYSANGAAFQERAIAHITTQNKANNPIGRLVTAINNNEITIDEAKQQFNQFVGYLAL